MWSKINKLRGILYGRVMFRKAKLGRRVNLRPRATIMNPRYMTIGDFCYFGPECRIEAWDRYNDKRYSPEIIFGRDVRINSTCHIGAINRIEIGDECLLGSHVLITDHSHGMNVYEELGMHPSKRDLYSKGDVIIGKRCWICENAVILPNVHIGEGCIIAANAVVTKDVPPFSVVAGNPGKVVRTVTPDDENG